MKLDRMVARIFGLSCNATPSPTTCLCLNERVSSRNVRFLRTTLLPLHICDEVAPLYLFPRSSAWKVLGDSCFQSSSLLVAPYSPLPYTFISTLESAFSPPFFHVFSFYLVSSHTKCPGNKKFATPSFTAYSCWHAPHTSFPSFIHVSSSILCRSFAVWLGSSSSSSCASAAGVASAVSSADAEDDEGSTRSAGVGAVGGSSGRPSSLHITLNSFHRMRGKMFFRNARFTSASTISSSASRGCRGKDAGFVLQALMAQVRKLRVRSFIFCVRVYVGLLD